MHILYLVWSATCSVFAPSSSMSAYLSPPLAPALPPAPCQYMRKGLECAKHESQASERHGKGEEKKGGENEERSRGRGKGRNSRGEKGRREKRGQKRGEGKVGNGRGRGGEKGRRRRRRKKGGEKGGLKSKEIRGGKREDRRKNEEGKGGGRRDKGRREKGGGTGRRESGWGNVRGERRSEKGTKGRRREKGGKKGAGEGKREGTMKGLEAAKVVPPRVCPTFGTDSRGTVAAHMACHPAMMPKYFPAFHMHNSVWGVVVLFTSCAGHTVVKADFLKLFILFTQNQMHECGEKGCRAHLQPWFSIGHSFGYTSPIDANTLSHKNSAPL
eukprot:365219-Chlamydomonas_euryale.AAC.8